MNTSDIKPSEIKEIREKFNMTQDKLASALKVARVTVAAWEAGKRKPSKKHGESLKILLDLMKDPKALLYGELLKIISHTPDMLNTLQLNWETSITGAINILALRINMGEICYKQNEDFLAFLGRLLEWKAKINRPLVLRPIKNKKGV
jgi:DNA-binding XRE family transcriptional regulator